MFLMFFTWTCRRTMTIRRKPCAVLLHDSRLHGTLPPCGRNMYSIVETESWGHLRLVVTEASWIREWSSVLSERLYVEVADDGAGLSIFSLSPAWAIFWEKCPCSLWCSPSFDFPFLQNLHLALAQKKLNKKLLQNGSLFPKNTHQLNL